MKEWSKIWRNSQLDVGLFHAFFVSHAYPRHSHDYYVIGLIERGVQSFTHRGAKYVTTPGGLILLNPGDDHTGEAADRKGFEYRGLYLTASHMQSALRALTGRHREAPLFSEIRVDHPLATSSVRALHLALVHDTSPLERETHFLLTLTRLISQYSYTRPVAQHLGNERSAVRRACEYIDAHFPEGITLTLLAEHVGLSPYYLLRVFRGEIGMPPHAYLESVRIRSAQKLLAEGMTIVQVAYETGFSSQSHFTNRFKRLIGVTPGQYVQQLGS